MSEKQRKFEQWEKDAEEYQKAVEGLQDTVSKMIKGNPYVFNGDRKILYEMLERNMSDIWNHSYEWSPEEKKFSFFSKESVILVFEDTEKESIEAFVQIRYEQYEQEEVIFVENLQSNDHQCDSEKLLMEKVEEFARKRKLPVLVMVYKADQYHIDLFESLEYEQHWASPDVLQSDPEHVELHKHMILYKVV